MSIFQRTSTASHSAAEILAAIRESPPVIAALADATSRKIEYRQRLSDTLASADRAAETQFLTLTADIEAALGAERKAEANWRKAGQRVAAASHTRSSASVALDRTRTQIESALRDGADNAQIDTFIRWIETETQRTSKQTLPGDAVTVSDRINVTTTTTTNRGSVLARLDALRSARTAAEGLRLLPDQSAVPDRLEKLRASLPPIHDEVRVTTSLIKRPEDRQFGVRAV